MTMALLDILVKGSARICRQEAQVFKRALLLVPGLIALAHLAQSYRNSLAAVL